MKEYICIYDEDDMMYILNPYAQNTELIRCKDCKFYRWESDMCDYPYATAQNVVHEDDFCSKAERRTDE